VVRFVQNIENAREKIAETGTFESDDIVDEEALEAALT
jgi:DNA helicase-2/ATP-dependent DNA helicase PcrA